MLQDLSSFTQNNLKYYVFNDEVIIYAQTIIFSNYLRGEIYKEILKKAYSCVVQVNQGFR